MGGLTLKELATPEGSPVIGGDVEEELRWEGVAVLGPWAPFPIRVSSSVTIKAQKCCWEGIFRDLLTSFPPGTVVRGGHFSKETWETAFPRAALAQFPSNPLEGWLIPLGCS